MAHEIVGRGQELGVVDATLDGIAGGAAGVLVTGDPGIGKTTVWEAGVARAVDRGWPVLQARPVEAEAKLSLATLSDLLEPVVDDVARDLPEPQRRALDVALLRAGPGAEDVDPRTLAVAVLGSLRALAARTPVVLAVDDLQWVDGPSALALAFAVRRLGAAPVLLLVAQRRGLDAAVDFTAGLPADRLARLELDGLSLGATGRLLDGLSPGLPRHMLRAVHQTSGGNPFYAQELARALGGRVVAPGEPLPVPADLRELVSARLQALAPDAREAVLAAACLAQPTPSAVAALLGDAAAPALAQAAAAGVIRLDEGRVRFTHPLLASTAYVEADLAVTRRLHRRLAEVLTSPEERARHLALAATGPDVGVAAALDAGADAAAARGAPGAAAELCEQAVALTPSGADEDRRRRKLAAAGYHFAAGDGGRAGTLLQEVATAMAPGPARAQVLGSLAEVRSRDADLAVATELLVEALAEAGDDARVRVPLELHLQLWLAHRGDPAGARASAHRALAHAEPLGDPALLSISLAAVAWADFLERQGVAAEQIERALALEDPRHPFSAIYRPTFTAAAMWTCTGQLDEACAGFGRVYRWVLEQGDESSIPLFGIVPVLAECMRGDVEAADRYADAVRQASEYIGGNLPHLLALNARITVDAYRGEAAAVHGAAAEVAALAERLGAGVLSIVPFSMVGFLALSQGDPAACDRALGPVIDASSAVPGIAQLLCALAAPDQVEALVELGRLDEAERLMAWYDDHAALGGDAGRASAARCRALVAAANGDMDAALAFAGECIDRYRELPMPVDRARSLLIAGRIHRRRKEKAAARAAFEEARATFAAVGSHLWAQRAVDELGRVAGRPSGHTELTPTEARVAALLAEGLTNREVGERAFLTPKSVEGVVTRVYRKLGIRSRAELGAAMAARARR